MNKECTYYDSVYNETETAVHNLETVRQTLGFFNYLSYEENLLLRRTIYTLYKKVVFIGGEIENYNDLETKDIPLPESEVE